jgi:lycopene elongase/hydratase (dihydrobisanhydrobacterioruberin-forming)
MSLHNYPPAERPAPYAPPPDQIIPAPRLSLTPVQPNTDPPASKASAAHGSQPASAAAGPAQRRPASASWLIESLLLKRIDAWGVSIIVAALALYNHQALSWQTALLLAAIGIHYWLGYWLNDYHDASRDGADLAKAHQNFFVQRPAGRGRVALVAGLLFGLSSVVYGSFGWRGLLVMVVNIAIIWAYSAPPLRLKSRPGLDLLTHALFVQPWPYLVCLWLIGARPNMLDAAVVSICFMASLTGQLYQQVRDYEVDRATDTNFATWVGRPAAQLTLRLSSLVLTLLFVAAVVAGALPLAFVPFGLLGLPKVAQHIFRRGRAFPARLSYASVMLAMAYTSLLVLWP